jgi:ABC-type lipoprotein release transport system permease subunit
MPEEYARKLAQTDIMVVQHLLPSLQERVLWPEKKRHIILAGMKGEEPRTNVKLRQLRDPVARGDIVLGNELHRSLELKVGDEVELMGRKFRVSKCHEERGNRDDVTAWVNLRDAQELLNKPGQINAILALQCNCPDSDLASIRRQVAKILPHTQVIERRSKALARAEARAEIRARGRHELAEARRSREQLRSERNLLVGVLVPIVLIACAVWIGMTAFGNVRERLGEIGILRAMGVRSVLIMVLFLGRALLMGCIGGVPGYLVGVAVGTRLGRMLDGSGAGFTEVFDLKMFLVSVVSACVLALAAGWLPALLAARQDPARILNG